MPEPLGTSIDARTRYCAVYGQPVAHSASPAMQNAGISALGLNWRYLAFEVRPENLAAAIQGAQAMHFIGLNLTVPHKILAVDLVDELDPDAGLWGAVNTIVYEGREEGGKWRPLREFSEAPREVRSHGYNTDAGAISRAIAEDLGLQLAGARVLLLGAGGAGRTAALKLAAEGVAELHLVNRTMEKVYPLAELIRQTNPAVRVSLGYPSGMAKVDLVLNATSLGLKGADPLPLDTSVFALGRAGAIFDMVYRPARTALMSAGEQAGCRVANGLGMLLYQGARALELWSGQAAPLPVMRRALEENVYG